MSRIGTNLRLQTLRGWSRARLDNTPLTPTIIVNKSNNNKRNFTKLK